MSDFSGATWRKSLRSQNSGACVEVARVANSVGVRDSKDPGGPILVVAVWEWQAFLDGVVGGEFDDLVR
jgi:hypothetical protein